MSFLRNPTAWLLVLVASLSCLVLFFDRLGVASGPQVAAHSAAHAANVDGPGRLRFATRTHDLGALAPGAQVEARFPWRREGAGSLHLAPLRADCGCAGLDGLPSRLAPGAQGELRVKIQAPDRAGPLVVRVRVVAGGAAPALLEVRAYVDRPVAFSPVHLRLGPLEAGAAFERTVRLRRHLPAGDASLPRPVARLVGIPGVVSVVDLPTTAGPAGGAGGQALAIVARAPRRPGRFRAALEVDLGPETRIRLPVSGEVVTRPGDVSESAHERCPERHAAAPAPEEAGGEAAPLPSVEPVQSPGRGPADPGLRRRRRDLPDRGQQGRGRR